MWKRNGRYQSSGIGSLSGLPKWRKGLLENSRDVLRRNGAGHRGPEEEKLPDMRLVPDGKPAYRNETGDLKTEVSGRA